MAETDNINRLEAIIDEAGSLSVERQESVLAVIKGMLFTRNLLTEQFSSGLAGTGVREDGVAETNPGRSEL